MACEAVGIRAVLEPGEGDPPRHMVLRCTERALKQDSVSERDEKNSSYRYMTYHQTVMQKSFKKGYHHQNGMQNSCTTGSNDMTTKIA